MNNLQPSAVMPNAPVVMPNAPVVMTNEALNTFNQQNIWYQHSDSAQPKKPQCKYCKGRNTVSTGFKDTSMNCRDCGKMFFGYEHPEQPHLPPQTLKIFSHIQCTYCKGRNTVSTGFRDASMNCLDCGEKFYSYSAKKV